MDLTPQSTGSPNSSFPYPPHPQPLYEYPSPAHTDPRYRSTESLQGLALYPEQMADSRVENGDQPPAPHLPSSTGTHSSSNHWSSTILQHPNEPTPRPSSHPSGNVLTAEFNPFAPFQRAVSSAAYRHDIYPSMQTAEVAILAPPSPVPSGNDSQRSSFSSAPASEIFTQAGSIHSYTPRIKMEDHPDYLPGSESMMLGSPTTHLGTSTGSYPGSEGNFYQDWPKVDYPAPTDLPPYSTLPIPSDYNDRRSHSHDGGSGTAGSEPPPHEPRRASHAVARTRQPRKLTTREDANFQCHVKGCGKLFGRSYNFKAHMETHDASRDYPFPCPREDCNKKFVRKTDLQRHDQSVHMKIRNHRCDYCNRHFARKDTLRRHMEDGCSKRFDIETVDFSPQSYINDDSLHSMKISARADDQFRPPSYSSAQYSPNPGSATSQGPHDSPLTSASGPYMESRHEYISADTTHDSVWTR
ncbi:hypothetical protein B7494_g8618 [Chlorociboria aeruginascens]|nr:hypothetical protein B7494_g8618 [Chlorociboria aeruginascens]